MSKIEYYFVNPNDLKSMTLIANWYLQEWNIPPDTTIKQLSLLLANGVPFQIIMTLDGSPIATGGLYNHTAQHDHEPFFKIPGAWFVLMYTSNANRNHGYGGLLCEEIQRLSKEFGLKQIFLFAYMGETLYKTTWVGADSKNHFVRKRDCSNEKRTIKISSYFISLQKMI